MDLEDADTLAARSQHADDAVAGDRAAGLEQHRHVVSHTPDRNAPHTPRRRLGLAAALELQRVTGCARQAEPAAWCLALGLGRAAAAVEAAVSGAMACTASATLTSLRATAARTSSTVLCARRGSAFLSFSSE